MRKIYVLGALLAMSLTNAQQTLPFVDSFSYPAGNLHQTSPWSVLGTASATDQILLDGSKVTFEAGGTDAQVTVTSQTTGTVYYAFDLTITGALAAVIDANGGYLAGFTQNATTFGGTLWIKKDPADATNTKFAFGTEVRTATGTATSFTPYSYDLGTTYKVLVGYTFNTGGASDDSSKLWINPTVNDEASPLITDTHTGADLTSIVSFFLRQDSATETPAVAIDNLKISTTFNDVMLSAEKFDNIAGLRVSPNPATTELNILSDSFAAKTVEMYDVLGKVALKATVTSQPLNISGLAKGVYVAKITEEGRVATRKVVVE
ncbi:T9SS type A sorting domain-containing protein [Flavobacterium sp.]|uniref:T9SS type A sorting domain-containing protein n=1 Tax=Flavobacterium sp. TaxID=239 RepID=UPI003D14517D